MKDSFRPKSSKNLGSFSDLELIQAYQNGNNEAISIFFTRHFNPFYHFASGHLRDPIMADEVIGQLLIQFLKTKKKLRKSKYKIEKNAYGYFLVAVKNKCWDINRRKKNQVIRVSLDDEIMQASLSKKVLKNCLKIRHLMDHEVKKILGAVLEALKGKEKKIFALYFEGWEVGDICEELDISARNVSSSLYNARKKAREIYTAHTQ